MGVESIRGLGQVSVEHLREYILDLLQELSGLAAHRGDAAAAEALAACWKDIRTQGEGAE
jgi:hypothetical protein